MVCSWVASSYFCRHTEGWKSISPFALLHVTVGVGVPTIMALKNANLPIIEKVEDCLVLKK